MNTVLFLKQQYKCGGNHPGMLIFDEPAQHSIGEDDLSAESIMRQLHILYVQLGFGCDESKGYYVASTLFEQVGAIIILKNIIKEAVH
ncbi:hypothetical protein ACTM96_13335 [Mediterraneibacter faecis]|uniref:hypothetical protein n=1 Tax=Mediterraneibacter faecis TaxID=592978 RepID=UPI003F8CC2DC